MKMTIFGFIINRFKTISKMSLIILIGLPITKNMARIYFYGQFYAILAITSFFQNVKQSQAYFTAYFLLYFLTKDSYFRMLESQVQLIPKCCTMAIIVQIKNIISSHWSAFLGHFTLKIWHLLKNDIGKCHIFGVRAIFLSSFNPYFALFSIFCQNFLFWTWKSDNFSKSLNFPPFSKHFNIFGIWRWSPWP